MGEHGTGTGQTKSWYFLTRAYVKFSNVSKTWNLKTNLEQNRLKNLKKKLNNLWDGPLVKLAGMTPLCKHISMHK